MLVVNESLQTPLKERIDVWVLVENRLDAAYPVLCVRDELRRGGIPGGRSSLTKINLRLSSAVVFGH